MIGLNHDLRVNLMNGTYILKPVLTKLCKKMKETQQSKPSCPPHDFIEFLNIQHTKNKDEFVENKVPESVLNLLQKKKKDMKKLMS